MVNLSPGNFTAIFLTTSDPPYTQAILSFFLILFFGLIGQCKPQTAWVWWEVLLEKLNTGKMLHSTSVELTRSLQKFRVAASSSDGQFLTRFHLSNSQPSHLVNIRLSQDGLQLTAKGLSHQDKTPSNPKQKYHQLFRIHVTLFAWTQRSWLHWEGRDLKKRS